MITRLRKTEQTGHVLETEIVAGVFPPVAEDNTEYSIEWYSALKYSIPHTHSPPHELKIMFIFKLSYRVHMYSCDYDHYLKSNNMTMTMTMKITLLPCNTWSILSNGITLTGYIQNNQLYIKKRKKSTWQRGQEAGAYVSQYHLKYINMRVQ